MKLNIEEVENGFIIEEDPELIVNGVKVAGKKHVFADLDTMQEFVKDFYFKRPNKNSSSRKKKGEDTP